MPAAGSGGVLLQAAANDEHLPTDHRRAGEGDVAAKHQDVAGHGSVEGDIAGENPHIAGGLSDYVGRAQNAARIVELLAGRDSQVASNLHYIRSGSEKRQNQARKYQTPWKHACGFLGAAVPFHH